MREPHMVRCDIRVQKMISERIFYIWLRSHMRRAKPAAVALAAAAMAFAWQLLAPSPFSSGFLFLMVDVAPKLSALRHSSDQLSQRFVHREVVAQFDYVFSEFGFAVVVGHDVQDAVFKEACFAAKGFSDLWPKK